MTWPNKRALVILFMALAMALAKGGQTIAPWLIGSQTMVSRPISFIGMVFSIKTAEAAETMAPEGYPEANKIEYKSEELRDPFQEEEIEIEEQPQVQIETKPLPSLQIQGIVWGGGFPQAIINNKVMRVGDTIEGVRITDINKNGVTVFFENQKYTLSVSSPVSSQDLGKKNP